jgi:signal transduction histidine kinase
MSTWRRVPGRGSGDLLLAAGLCALAELEVALADGDSRTSLLSAAVCTLPLAVRRRVPLVAAAGVFVSAVVDRALDGTWAQPFVLILALLIAGYSVAAYASLPTAVLGELLAFAGWALNEWWWATPEYSDLNATAALFAAPWVAGRFVRRLRREAEQLTALAASLERERQASARLAVAEERARLARELHDAVAHAVSAMVIQGAAAEAVMSGAPGDARRSLRAVETMGRDAVTEMRRMLRILRTAPGEAARPELGERPRRPAFRRLRLRWSPRLDVLMAAGCFVAAEQEVLRQYVYGQPRWPSALLMAAATLPLAMRRRFPLTVMLTSTGALAIQQFLDDWQAATPVTLLIAPLIAAYTVGAHSSPRRVIAGTAGAALISAVASALVWSEGIAWFLFAFSGLFLIPALTGQAVRMHRRNAEGLRKLTGRLRRERDALARLAIVEERSRLARELHDAIAHGVSVMVLQAGAAEQVMSSAPEQARQATRAVQDTGRSVLEELGRLLGLLHTDEENSPRGPQPSLAHLNALVTDVREAGLPIQLRVVGEPAGVSAGVDASAYRVIQEALTNALKHAGQARTAVSVQYEPTALTLEVLSEGAGTGARPAGEGGHGLVGMRERVELYGGDLRAGPEPTGGYAVRARLPLGSEGE